VNAEAITAALRAVMGSPDYRQRAGRVADDIRAMANPAEVAEFLATRYGHKP
jgi:UDP:flavonoid glycosyltransferase YjiC (YdhE family)